MSRNDARQVRALKHEALLLIAYIGGHGVFTHARRKRYIAALELTLAELDRIERNAQEAT